MNNIKIATNSGNEGYIYHKELKRLNDTLKEMGDKATHDKAAKLWKLSMSGVEAKGYFSKLGIGLSKEPKRDPKPQPQTAQQNQIQEHQPKQVAGYQCTVQPNIAGDMLLELVFGAGNGDIEIAGLNRKSLISVMLSTMHHFENKVTGKKVEFDEHGNKKIIATGSLYHKGDLTPSEVLIVVKKAHSLRMEPTDMHVWYQGGSGGGLQVCPPNQHLLALAKTACQIYNQTSFELYSRQMTDTEKTEYNLAEYDIGCITYVRLRTDLALWTNLHSSILGALVSAGTGFTKAEEQANEIAWKRCSPEIGIGIMSESEAWNTDSKGNVTLVNEKPQKKYMSAPKGRPHWWKAEKRSIADAVRKKFPITSQVVDLLAINSPESSKGFDVRMHEAMLTDQYREFPNVDKLPKDAQKRLADSITRQQDRIEKDKKDKATLTPEQIAEKSKQTLEATSVLLHGEIEKGIN